MDAMDETGGTMRANSSPQPITQPDTETLMSLSYEKTTRDLERDLVRQSRGYEKKIEATTTSVVRKPIAPGTRRFYQVMLREWDIFTGEYDGSPDPTNVKTAKDFIHYFSSGRRGRNEPGGCLTVAYTYTAWKSFMAAWGREHHVSFSKSHQDTILNFINGGEESGAPDLSRKTRPTRNFTRDDFLICVQQLWQNDWHDFVHERYRWGLHLLLLLHCNTSGRRAEYEGELTYADISVAMVWLDNATQSQLIIDFRRTKAKGLQRYEREQPQHMLYELVGLPYYCNSVGFFMAAALADGVLRDYHSWDDICAIERPPQQKHVILEYNPEKSNWPIFPRSSRAGQLDHGRHSASLTSNALLDLGFRAGFRDHLTLHAARREVLLQVDNYGYSCNERMRFAAHINPNTYRRSYQTSIPIVDGQASYFQYEPRNTELHALRRGYSWRRNPHHQPELREATRVAIQYNTSEKQEDARDDFAWKNQKERQKVYDQRRGRRDHLLRQQYSAAPQPDGRPYESDFNQTRKLMPERDRLATSLFMEGSLRDDTGRTIMNDLIHLCRQGGSATYCLGLNPSGTLCATCGERSRKGDEHSWWSHLYRCRTKAARRDGGFAEFCFLCFVWYDDHGAWRRHVQEHLRDLPLKCNMAVFRHNVVRPALCPACLGDESLNPEHRFRQYVNLTTWKSHLQDHLQHGLVQTCPHPRCRHGSETSAGSEFLGHLADVHGIRFESKKRSESGKDMSSRMADGTMKGFSFVHVDFSGVGKTGEDSCMDAEALCQSGKTQSESRVEDEEMVTTEQDLGCVVPVSKEGGRADSADSFKVSGEAGDNSHGEFQPTLTASLSREVATSESESQTTKQTPIRKQPGLSINVPPVPRSWKSRKKPRLAGYVEDATIPIPAEGVSRENSSQRSSRGRPRGSRSGRPLCRVQHQAFLARSRPTRQTPTATKDKHGSRATIWEDDSDTSLDELAL